MESFYSEQQRKRPEGRRSAANTRIQGRLPEVGGEWNAGLAGQAQSSGAPPPAHGPRLRQGPGHPQESRS